LTRLFNHCRTPSLSAPEQPLLKLGSADKSPFSPREQYGNNSESESSE
jgi:hypothetical protein